LHVEDFYTKCYVQGFTTDEQILVQVFIHFIEVRREGIKGEMAPI